MRLASPRGRKSAVVNEVYSLNGNGNNGFVTDFADLGDSFCRRWERERLGGGLWD